MPSCQAATEPVARSRAATPEEFGRLLDGFQARVDRDIAAFLAAKRGAADLASPASQPRFAAHRLARGESPDLADPADLVDAIARLMAQGGKRLRPALVYFTYRACGGRAEEQVLPLALSTELLHTYLLIHDDIMDHAETRRGQPAAHVLFASLHQAGGLRGDAGDFGRSAALLVGDLAHTFAVELFTTALAPAARDPRGIPALPATAPTVDRPADLRELTRCFAEMSAEVIGGQYLEFLLAHRVPEAISDGPSGASPSSAGSATFAGPGGAGGADAAPAAPAAGATATADAAEVADHREAELLRILRLKSGRYTAERPIQLGAILAGAPAAARAVLSRYGTAVGEAFQLQDDLLGVFGDPATTGKPVGDDLREGKYTLLIHRALLALAAAAHCADSAVDGAAAGAASPSSLSTTATSPSLAEAGADRRFLLGALGNSGLTAAEVARAQGILERTGARDAVSAMTAERLDAARAALDDLDALDALDALNGADALDARSHPTDETGEGALFLAGLLDYLRERNR
jgi:geranylgeranyl diphosphate synthase type I